MKWQVRGNPHQGTTACSSHKLTNRRILRAAGLSVLTFLPGSFDLHFNLALLFPPGLQNIHFQNDHKMVMPPQGGWSLNTCSSSLQELYLFFPTGGWHSYGWVCVPLNKLASSCSRGWKHALQLLCQSALAPQLPGFELWKLWGPAVVLEPFPPFWPFPCQKTCENMVTTKSPLNWTILSFYWAALMHCFLP